MINEQDQKASLSSPLNHSPSLLLLKATATIISLSSGLIYTQQASRLVFACSEPILSNALLSVLGILLQKSANGSDIITWHWAQLTPAL